MVLAVIEMLEVGKASAVGWKTVVVYLSTTLAAAIWGVLIATAFIPFFTEASQASTSKPKVIQLGEYYLFKCTISSPDPNLNPQF
jgi:Na+/H+-dicarboxylate symporter